MANVGPTRAQGVPETLRFVTIRYRFAAWSGACERYPRGLSPIGDKPPAGIAG